MVNETVPKDILDKLDSGVTTTDIWKTIADTGTLTCGSMFANVTEIQTVYTVGVGKVLYITTLSLAGENTSADYVDDANMRLNELLVCEMYVAKDSTSVVSLSPTIPLRLAAGQTIKIEASAYTKVFGSFSGYLVDA